MLGIVKNDSHGHLKRCSQFFRRQVVSQVRVETTLSDHEQLELKGIWNEVHNLPW